MKLEIRLFLGLLALGFLLLAGCATRPSQGSATNQGVSVPFPATTPFDSNPQLRAAYLKGYGQGFVKGLIGTRIQNHYKYGYVPSPEELGWDIGNLHGCMRAWGMQLETSSK